MKKTISFLLLCLLLAGLTACGAPGTAVNSVKVTNENNQSQNIVVMSCEEAGKYLVEKSFDNANWQDYLVLVKDYRMESFLVDNPSVSVTVTGTALRPLPQYANGIFDIHAETTQTESYTQSDGTVTEPLDTHSTKTASTTTAGCMMVWPDVWVEGDGTRTYTYAGQSLDNVFGTVTYYDVPESKINTDKATGLRYIVIEETVYCFDTQQMYHYDAASGTVTDFPD